MQARPEETEHGNLKYIKDMVIRESGIELSETLIQLIVIHLLDLLEAEGDNQRLHLLRVVEQEANGHVSLTGIHTSRRVSRTGLRHSHPAFTRRTLHRNPD